MHAVAGPYRVRSHFEAQDCLESGADHRMTSGWLNRVVGALPAAAARPPKAAIAIGMSMPLLLRGPARVGQLGAARLRAAGARICTRRSPLSAGDP